MNAAQLFKKRGFIACNFNGRNLFLKCYAILITDWVDGINQNITILSLTHEGLTVGDAESFISDFRG